MMKLRVEDLSLSYEGKPVLSGVSFHAEEGEFVTFLGPSGCGKSTMLNILAGLWKADEGRVFVDDKAVNGVTDHFAYMPQSDLLLPWKTILENVTLYGALHHDRKHAEEEALKEFPRFGLEGYENAYPAELSGGMRQRAAFLRTALCSADIMLLDEPFGALDVITREDMQDWLLNLRSKLNRTTILVTHDVDEALYLSDRILILSHNPATIAREIDLRGVAKSRAWLYNQIDLRREIYALLRS
jgi:NitT/TauT family transport system ATP-binding protein